MHTRLSEWSARLAALPDFEPPEAAWQAIQAACRSRDSNARLRWPLALAATLLAAVAGMPFLLQPAQHQPVSLSGLTSDPASPATEAIQAQNARLESLLATLPERRAMRGSTAFTVSQLEDRLALVDDRLSRIAMEPNAPEFSERLWRERVELMNSLVQVRYADAASPL
jgi:hypothetical protein